MSVTLGDVCTFLNGGTPSTKYPSILRGQHPLDYRGGYRRASKSSRRGVLSLRKQSGIQRQTVSLLEPCYW